MHFAVEDVSDFVELKERIATLGRGDDAVLFRGQTSLHDGRITPSLARVKNHAVRKLQYFHDHWHDVLGMGLLDGSLLFPLNWNDNPETSKNSFVKQGGMGPVEQGAILQHYGERSHFVDVTSSLDVAVWFAHHDWIGQFVNERHPEGVREHSCATYKRTTRKYGYVFVLHARRRDLGVLKPRHGEFVDISIAQNSGRMVAQRAALMYTNINKADGDVSRQVIAAFRFAIPLPGAECLDWPTTQLFPPPSNDPFLGLLLSSTPYLSGAPRQRRQRRLIKLPEYYDVLHFRQSPLWSSYRARDCEVGFPFFHYVLRVAKSPDGGRLDAIEPFSCLTSKGRRDVRHAVAILNMSSTRSLHARNPVDHMRFDGATSVFFEYGPMQAIHGKDNFILIIGERMNEHVDLQFHYVDLPHIRGIWIVQDGNRFYARLYGGSPDVGLQITSGSWFCWEDGDLSVSDTVDPNTAEDERLALVHALGVLSGLATGVYSLFRPKGQHYHWFIKRSLVKSPRKRASRRADHI
jgi:hypothetical protein